MKKRCPRCKSMNFVTEDGGDTSGEGKYYGDKKRAKGKGGGYKEESVRTSSGNRECDKRNGHQPPCARKSVGSPTKNREEKLSRGKSKGS